MANATKRFMIKKSIFFFIALLFQFVLLPFAALAEERINSYVVHIELQPNGSAFVQEEIVYDFGETPRHGIFRRIPLIYKLPGDSHNRTIEISSIMVTDGLGNLRQTAYDKGGNILELKIGDPEVTVTGKQLYVIRYTVWGAAYALPDKDKIEDKIEFYWNATGNDWPSPIDRARVEVVLPVPVNNDRITSACYVGYSGSTVSCKSASSLPVEGDGTTITMLRYEHDGLYPHEGITVAVGLPEGTMHVVGAANNPGININWSSDSSSASVFFPFIIPLAVLLVMFRSWWKHGRDPKGRGTIVPEYDVPDGLAPMEAGTLWGDDLNLKSIVAGIIGLAIRGYLKIKQTEKEGFFGNTDFLLTKLKEPDAAISPSERLVLNTFFSDGTVNVLLSSLNNKLVFLKDELSRLLFDEMTRRGYFVANPLSVRRNYMIAGAAIAGIAIFLPIFKFAIFLSGIIVLGFGWLMPKKSERGAMTTEKLEGLRQYLSVAEADRIKFHNAPEKNPTTFERMLPYAIIFGVEDKWAEQFANLYTQKDADRWYVGNSAGGIMALTKNLASFSAATGAAFSARDSASGGRGMSGGGAGGGGGGSW